MDTQSLYLIKQGIRIISLLAAAGLVLGLGLCNLSMIPDLISDPRAGGYGVIVWPVWITVWLFIVGLVFSARATWRQFQTAKQVQKNDPPQT